LNKYY